ncbi:prostaglandin F2 receptor negative regulator-like [Clupea harengus]|uniref:Prostaglandin F2 receptor negative regulator-like n=1 Tax=Clupea harengus TaxID=7950 RepID=A0A6P3WE71_CLUHA|nr:prostaglandin F2 receptor negative regulator-like [Clupea harengus]
MVGMLLLPPFLYFSLFLASLTSLVCIMSLLSHLVSFSIFPPLSLSLSLSLSLALSLSLSPFLLHSLLSSPPLDDMVFELRWFLTRLRGSDSPVLLATMDRRGAVKKSPRNDSSDVSLERSGPRSYTLSVYSAQDSDTGEYHCGATPWIRSPTTGSWSQAPALTSARVFLNVKFALWDSMRMPLLYGVCAAAAMGLLSLLLGLICTRCCCRNTAYTPRPRNKLMELEMD